jgi:DNA-binding transcriptional MerR regulator
MQEPPVCECLDTAKVADLARVNRSTLDYWLRTGLIHASLRSEPGRRRTRLWSVKDAVVVRTVAELRASGCSLQRIRDACRQLDNKWEGLKSNTTLRWEGGDLIQIDEEGRAESLVNAPHQQVFRLTEVPVGQLRADTSREVRWLREDNLAYGVPAKTPEEARRAVAR